MTNTVSVLSLFDVCCRVSIVSQPTISVAKTKQRSTLSMSTSASDHHAARQAAFSSQVGGLGGTTGSALDSRSEGREFDSH